MREKTIDLSYDNGDEVIIKVLNQRGIVTSLAVDPGDSIRYQIEYSAGGEVKSRWMYDFEIATSKDSAIGFAKEC